MAFQLAVVNSHPIQYYAPLYRYLNQDPDLNVTVMYCSDFSVRGSIDPGFKHTVMWDIDLLSGYRAIFLGAAARKRTPNGFWSLVCPEIWSEIRRGEYDAILLYGYGYAVNILALLAAKTKGIPVLLNSETHLGLHRKRWKRWLRDAFLSIAYRFIDGFLAIGTANREYYRALGVPDCKIFDMPYAVDNKRFITSATLTSEQRSEVKTQYGLPSDLPVVLYASKLMRRKHPDDLIHAMAAIRDMGLNATLFIVGTGEMEAELKELASRLSLNNVVFGGFVNQANLPHVYAVSDIFVLPSENETWGLVVNEAMCASVPVVVSEEVGCVPDLVKDGVNGYHIKARDISTLVIALKRLLADKSARRRMGDASYSIISKWGYEECRSGIKAALDHCTRKSYLKV